jgi:maltose O-acetyltransferase
MIGRSLILQVVNFIFGFMPLTRWYRLRAYLLRAAGVGCSPSARIVASARIVTTNVTIGDDTFIGHQALITGNEVARIHIGNNVDIAPRVVILSGTHDIDWVGPHSAGPGNGMEVHIGDGVWIGANSTVVPGVTIGTKAVIGAGSVVSRDIPPFCIAVGNPCRPIKQWDPDSKSLRPFEA